MDRAAKRPPTLRSISRIKKYFSISLLLNHPKQLRVRVTTIKSMIRWLVSKSKSWAIVTTIRVKNLTPGTYLTRQNLLIVTGTISQSFLAQSAPKLTFHLLVPWTGIIQNVFQRMILRPTKASLGICIPPQITIMSTQAEFGTVSRRPSSASTAFPMGNVTPEQLAT